MLFRVVQYAWQRSYWLDEGWLLVNIRDQPWGELLGHLDHGQAAPAAFLVFTRVLVELFGTPEWAMRFLPFVAGCLGLVVFTLLVRRVGIGARATLMVVAMFALCESAILYSATLKQYSTDILCSMMVLWVVMRENQGRGERMKRAAMLTAVLVWWSFPVVLVYAACWLTLAPGWWKSLTPPRGRRLLDGGVALWATICLASWLTLYLLVMRHQRDPYLQTFWAGGFANFAEPLSIPRWLVSETYNLSDRLCSGLGAVVIGLWVVGGVWLWREGRREMLGFCVAPIAMTVLVACFKLYPYKGGRVGLFLLPGMTVLAGFGLEALVRWGSRGWQVAAAATAPFVVIGLITSGIALFEPRSRSMIRPAVEFVQQQCQPGDVVYLVAEGKKPDTPVISGYEGKEFFCYWPKPTIPILNELPTPPAPSGGRFWIVFTFVPRYELKNIQPLLDRLSTQATEEKRLIHRHGGGAVLFRQN